MAYTPFNNGFYKSSPDTPQCPTFQCNAEDVLHFCQNYTSVPYGHTTLGISVTFPAFAQQNAAITEFPQQQKPLYSNRGESQEDTCGKCKLKKRETLNRQVCELVKKHGPVEVAGKEILGWYILLAAEDRKIIKEYGSIAEFLKDNTSLLIINNWINLKSECDLKTFDNYSGNYYSFMESLESTEHKYSTNYTAVSYDGVIHSPGHADANSVKELVIDVNPHRETLWVDEVKDFNKEEMQCGNTISMYEYETQASRRLENWDTPIGTHEMNWDKKHFEASSPSAVPPLGTTFNVETVVDLTDVTPCSQHLTKDPFGEKQIVGDCQVISKELSDSDLSTYMQTKIKYQNCKETVPAICEISESFDDSGITEGGIIIENSNFKGSGREVAQDESHSTLQVQKYLSNNSDNAGDQECSTSDILDDETFLSVKSGSYYSRSSSPFSLDDITDVEQCPFEEALEDLSSFSFYSQVNHSQVPLCSSTDDGHLYFPINKSSVVKKLFQTNHAEMNYTAIGRKTEQRNISDCCHDKETQTIKMDTQDSGVNTDDMTNGIFSLSQDVIQSGTGACKNMEHCKGTKGRLPSTSNEALLQRAVKAELQLVDVQHWLCWQLCWKTQQQSMEKQAFLSMHSAPAEQSTTAVPFNLLLALAEVEEKYQEMKKQIQSGVPLDTLIPLTMQFTNVETPPDDLQKECFKYQHSGTQKVSDGPSEDFQKLKSVGKDLASASIHVTQKDQQEEEREARHLEHLSEGKSHYYVHVGNIAPSIKEGELSDIFQQYNMSIIFLEESSLKSSYAVLVFTCSEQAQAAVREIDGKMFCGQKFKVRAIKNSNYNIPFAFQISKTSSATLPQENVKFGTFEPKVCVAQQPPKSGSTLPKPVPHGDTPKVQGSESLKYKSSIPHNAIYAFPTAPYSNMSTFSHFMPPGYPWMLQSLHSNMMAYCGIPNPMFMPYSYAQYKLPGCPPFPLQVPLTNPNICMPDFNMKSNASTYFGKDGSSHMPAKAVNPVYAKGDQSNCGDSVQNNTMSSTAEIRISEIDTSEASTISKPTTVQSVSKPASVLTTSDKGKLANSETASSASSIMPGSVPITLTMPCKVADTVTDSWSTCGNLTTHNSVPSNLKSTAPLRVSTFVPHSVTIPKPSKSSTSILPANPISETGVLSSTNEARVSSIVASQEGDSVPSGEMDSGVYPQIDTSSEFPVIIIPNQLNFCQFKKVMTRLTELHKDVARDKIVGTLEEMRKSRGGSLGGLTIPEIISEASSKLAARKMLSV